MRMVGNPKIDYKQKQMNQTVFPMNDTATLMGGEQN